MKLFLRFFCLLAFLFIYSCNESPTTETDNIYRFKEYISYNSHGRVSIADPIQVQLVKSVDQFELTQEIPNDYLDISPNVKGKLYLENGNKLLFKPEDNLKPATDYSVEINLKKLYGNVKKGYETYTFSFSTIVPNYKIQLGTLQSYDKDWQFLHGEIETADLISLTKAKQLIEASQDKASLQIKWTDSISQKQYFSFTIDSIRRKIEDDSIKISWNGKAIAANHSGTQYFSIPGQRNFKIVSIKANTTQQSSVSINFSDPIAPQQDFAGLVSLNKDTNMKFEVNGNVLHIYPSKRMMGKVKLEVFTGIKNTSGFQLKTNFEEWVSFEQLKPEVRMISKGSILPASSSTPIYFETVNLAAVDVRVIKIFEDNVLQFLQESNLNQTNSYELRRVGRKVAQKTIALTSVNTFDESTWTKHALNLSELIKTDPGAIYQVEISFRKEYSTYPCTADETTETKPKKIVQAEKAHPDEQYREEQYWDNELYDWRNTPYNWQERDNPCSLSYYHENRFANLNVLGSDIGFVVKESNNQAYHFAVTNLLSAQPEANAKVSLYNYQQQLIASKTTDKDGLSNIDSDRKAAFAIAQKGNNYAYIKLDDGESLSLSKFDVSGQHLQQGLKGYLYTERGVHRPGDTIHLTFVLNDLANPIPKNHPINILVTDARERVVLQKTISETKNPDHALNGFYYFPIPTKQEDPTGNWHAKVNVGGASYTKTLKVATVKPNRLKIRLAFDKEILTSKDPIAGNIQSNWLHGAPARNLKAEVELKLTPSNEGFKGYEQYVFNDPVRDFETIEMKLATTQLSESGAASFSKPIELNKKAPGMLNANFLTKVYEGGGDFSMDVYTKPLAPFTHFVGLQSPETKRYGSYETDTDVDFNLVSLTDEGKPAPHRELEVYVYKIEWRWWWNRGRDNLSRYENTQVHRATNNFHITTDASGKSSFTVNIPDEDGGRYLIRILDKKSGHATGKVSYFYKNWWRSPSDADPESAKILAFSSDKKEYKVGEEAIINFPSGSGGRALVSVENGTEVLTQEWVTTQKGETQVRIPLSKEMAPNVYVNISLLQPHAQTKNDLPIRLYGVIPLMVENPATKLHPVLQAPAVLRPETDYSLKVSEKDGKEMTYTLAVVDEGLLDLTRFPTPNIHEAFYAREALGVHTFDIFDDVIGAFSGSVNNIYEIGGGDLAAGAKNRKANRFKPVVTYLGPFHLNAGETSTHNLWMPNYVGSVRAMLVTGDNNIGAYGSTDQTIPVRKPLMVLASVARKLSPGEKITLPVTVFAMEKNVKNVTVKVKADEAFVPIGSTEKNISFNEVGEQIVNFDFEIKAASGPQSIQVYASGNGENSKTFVELDVENPNPYSQTSETYTLQGNENRSIHVSPFGVEVTNSASIVFSTLPPMDLEKRINSLIHYPHGCIEQTTSAAFPQLFLSDIVDMTFQQKKEAEENIKAALNKLSDFHLPSGGLSYWPGNSQANDWGTTYAGHFALEAKQKGYALPISFLSNWIRYQQTQARQWRNSYTAYNSSLNQAYRLYTLALSGNPELAAMNRLRESNELSNDAKWRLAAAYALIGKEQVAKEIRNSATLFFDKTPYNHYSYGSVFRNKAMALETAVSLHDNAQRELAESLAKGLSSTHWYSTQETAYALMALAKMAITNGGKSIKLTYTLNGKKEEINSEKSIATRALVLNPHENNIEVTNEKANNVFVSISQSGKLPLGKELVKKENLSVKTQFLDGEEKPITVSKLRQGTELTAKIVVTNTSMDNVENIALTQLFPSGWEIVNTRFTNFGGSTQNDADYTDIRDDRVNFYFDLARGKSKTFTVKLNTSYLGKYYLPGTQAEAMYDHAYFARTQGMWVEVIK